MPRPDEGMIHAWLDGELPPEEAARVERLVAEDAEWAAAAAEARGLIAASSRILGALDVVPGDVIPKGSRAAPAPGPVRVEKPRARFTVRPWMRAAAGIVVVVGTALIWRGARGSDGARVDAVEVTQEAASAPAASAAAAPPTTRAEERRAVVPDARDAAATSPQAAAKAPLVAAATTTGAPERILDSPSSIAMPPARADSARQAAAGLAAAPRDASRAEAERTAPAPATADAALLRGRAALALAEGPAFTAKAAPDTTVGCWLVRLADGRDTLLVRPRVLRHRPGDTLIVQLDPARATVTYAARRVPCPAVPE